MRRSTKAKRRARAKKPAKKPAKKQVAPIPPGYHSLTPSLTVRGAAQAIEFYKRAFGARELMRMPSPDGKIMHAELKIGDSIFFVQDEFPDMGSRSPQSLGGTAGYLYAYVRDVDRIFRQAVEAGAQAQMPLTDMFWGDRFGRLADPFGQEWGLASRKEDLSPREVGRRSQAYFAQMSSSPPSGERAG